MKKLLFVLTFFSLLAACSDLEKEQQIKRVQQAQKQLDQLTLQLQDPRIQDISTYKVNTIQAELKIKQNLYLDTIDLALAKQLDAFKIMRRSIKPLMKQYQKVSAGIREERGVLKLLKQDIKQGRGERQRYNEFIQFEQNKVAQLAALTTDFQRAKKQFFNDYNRLYPPVNTLANQLLEKAARRR
ncbi:MAG: hypothetical protein ACKOBN_06740 [Flavobacteriales bacterium]